jgi:tetratricopeptide (TPR) repeat protein
MIPKLCICLFLLSVLGGCARDGSPRTSQSTGPRTLAEIETAVAAGQYAESIAPLEALAQRDPGDARVQYYLGLCLAHQNDLEKAEFHYRAALDIDEHLAEARSNLGLLMIERGKLDEAMEALTVYIQANPDDGSGYYNLGFALEAKGDLAAAKKNYKKASELAPQDPQPYRALGDVARLQGRIDEALTLYRRALTHAPGDPELILVLAEALIAAKRIDDAVSNLMVLGKSEAAEAPTLATAAVLLSGVKKYEKATSLLQVCTNRFPDYANGFFLLGTAYARGKQWTEAIAQFEKFLTLEPHGDKAEVARRHLDVCRSKVKTR